MKSAHKIHLNGGTSVPREQFSYNPQNTKTYNKKKRPPFNRHVGCVSTTMARNRGCTLISRHHHSPGQGCIGGEGGVRARSRRRSEGVGKTVRSGCCRLQMPMGWAVGETAGAAPPILCIWCLHWPLSVGGPGRWRSQGEHGTNRKNRQTSSMADGYTLDLNQNRPELNTVRI